MTVSNSTGSEGFVERLYKNVLGRVGDDQGIADQVQGMKDMGAAQITYNFYNSSEFKEKSQNMPQGAIVENVYMTMLNRGSDPSGKAMWITYLNNGMSACALVAGFAESNEFGNTCANYGIGTGSADQLRTALEPRDKSANMTAFASRLYTKCLNRTYDVDGLNCQTGALQKGTPYDQIAVNFFCSPEFSSFDLDSEEKIQRCYQTMLDRDCESKEAMSYWQERLANEGLESVVRGFCESDEFKAICANPINIIELEKTQTIGVENKEENIPTASDFTYAAPTNLTYDGNAKVATITSTKEGMGAVNVEYSSDSGNTWIATAPTNAGTYLVRANVAKGDAYAAQIVTDPSWKFTIGQKQLKVAGTSVESKKAYDGDTGATLTNNGTLEGVIEGDAVTLSATASFDTPNGGIDKSVTVVYGIAGTSSGNYLTPANGSLKADIYCTVAYNGNGATSGSAPTDSTEYYPGNTVTVLGNTESLAKTGCTFSGWNTNASGTGGSYAEGATETMGDANITLYAQWAVAAPDISNVTTRTAYTLDQFKAMKARAKTDADYAAQLNTLAGKGYAYLEDVTASAETTISATLVNDDSAGLTFMTDGDVTTSAVNSVGLSTGNFSGTELYTKLAENGDIYKMFATDLMAAVTPQAKVVSTNYNSTKGDEFTTLTAQKLWLPSYSEVFGKSKNAPYNAGSTGEGDQLSGFIKSSSSYYTAWKSGRFWLRSADGDNSLGWLYVSSGSGYSGSIRYDSFGVRPCFTL